MTFKNAQWALYTGLFKASDIGRIEREFLAVLNFELGISEGDLLANRYVLLTPLKALNAHRGGPTYSSDPLGCLCARFALAHGQMQDRHQLSALLQICLRYPHIRPEIRAGIRRWCQDRDHASGDGPSMP